jgi:aspartate aminotransferase
MQAFAEKSSWIRKMFEEGTRLKAEFGAENVYDFSLGNPDVPPPPEFYDIISARAADRSPGVHSYMPNNGYAFVREAIADTMSREQQVTVNPNDMLMTCGAAGGLNVVMKALLNPGEEIIFLAPYFVEYGFYVDNHGGVSRVVNTDAEFNLDLEAIEAALCDKTKAIIVNSPNNPTGQVYSQESLTALGQLLDKAGKKFGTTIYMISDEPYRKIIFDGLTVPSIFTSYTNSIIVSSYSKDLSLPGERIGYIAVHPEMAGKAVLVGAMNLANRILGFVNAPALMQRVVAELQQASVDNSIYARRRDIFCKVLTNAGYTITPPKGAFYIFLKTPIEDDVKFCALLQEEKILAVPGRGFGTPGYIRLAFCVPDAVISASAEAFKRALQKSQQLV